MQQQEIVKVLQDGQKFNCESHPEYQLQTIYFGDNKLQKKSRFFCQECLIEASEDSKNLNIYAIPIQKFLKHPDFIVDKILTLKNNDLIDKETQIINKLNEDIDKFEGLLKQQINLMRQNLQDIQFKIQIANLKNQILSKVDVKELYYGLSVVLSMDSHQGTEEFKLLEKKLNASSEYLQQMRNGAIDRIEINQRELINKLHENIQTLSSGLENLAKIIMGQLSTMTTGCIPPSIYDEIKDFPQIHQLISDGKKIDYKLIYQGSRDFLSAQYYWNKCNNQSHLLTIMTSKNGYKFGGYSPCIVNVDLASYVEDPTMKSFLFQYNKKEIYKIKYQKNAVYCKSEFGPCFGGGYDLFIGEDFNNKGYSKGLGHSYDISNYKISDKSTHIFGSTTPQLQECKVYKISFI